MPFVSQVAANRNSSKPSNDAEVVPFPRQQCDLPRHVRGRIEALRQRPELGFEELERYEAAIETAFRYPDVVYINRMARRREEASRREAKRRGEPYDDLAKSTSAPVSLTVITNSNGPATKVFSINEDGKLDKKSAAIIYEGTAERRQIVGGIRGLLALINKLESNLKSGQALLYGVTEAERARVVTQKALKKLNGSADGVIARDAEHCKFAEGKPGVFMGDYDPREGHPPLGAEELDRILCEVAPQLAAVERAWRPSATAFVYDRDGNELKGSWGWRLYFLVDDASQIPRIGAAIYQALWAAGHGHIQLSKSSAMLDRSLLDASVWQGERLDFAAPPILESGLVRMLPEELARTLARSDFSGRAYAPRR